MTRFWSNAKKTRTSPRDPEIRAQGMRFTPKGFAEELNRDSPGLWPNGVLDLHFLERSNVVYFVGGGPSQGLIASLQPPCGLPAASLRSPRRFPPPPLDPQKRCKSVYLLLIGPPRPSQSQQITAEARQSTKIERK